MKYINKKSREEGACHSSRLNQRQDSEINTLPTPDLGNALSLLFLFTLDDRGNFSHSDNNRR
jgi:hypothetical protein